MATSNDRRPSERLDPVVDDAVQALRRYFKGDELDRDIGEARLASTILGTWAKLKQTERAQEGIYFNMAVALSSDRDELARYMQMTLPHVPLAKVLDAKQLPKPETPAKKE